MEYITAHNLKEQLALSDITILDVQSEENYVLEHLPGAVNVPLGLLEDSIGLLEMPKDSHVVVYAANPYDGNDAARILEESGYQHVSVLDGGLLDWEDQHYSVEGAI
jgi:rhodanese-related sulfurtransferase